MTAARRILLNKDQAAAAMVAAVKRQRETKNASGNQGARPIGKELRLSDRASTSCKIWWGKQTTTTPTDITNINHHLHRKMIS